MYFILKIAMNPDYSRVTLRFSVPHQVQLFSKRAVSLPLFLVDEYVLNVPFRCMVGAEENMGGLDSEMTRAVKCCPNRCNF